LTLPSLGFRASRGSDPFYRERSFLRPIGVLYRTQLNARRRLAMSGKKSAAIVITRLPEVITCVKISIPEGKDVFMVFDSHPRSDHPGGTGFTFSTSIDATASYLDNLLPIDQSILFDESLEWQTQLLANFSGLLFVAKTTRFDSDPIEAERAMIESGLTILALQAEVAELKLQNAALQKELKTAELKVQEERPYPYKSSNPPRSSRKSTEPEWLPAPTKKKNDNGTSSSPADHCPSMFSSERSPPVLTDRFLAPSTPLVYYSGEPQLNAEWPSLPSRKHERPAESSVPPRSHSTSPPRALFPPAAIDDDLAVLVELQQQFDDEDSRLRGEREALASVQQPIFTCAVCTDEFSEEDVARVPGCGHGFCRECLRTYAISKLEEHRFPILCPSCVADDTGKEPGSKSYILRCRRGVVNHLFEVINSSLVIDVGISEHYFQIFEELEMSSFSILLHCKK